MPFFGRRTCAIGETSVVAVPFGALALRSAPFSFQCVRNIHFGRSCCRMEVERKHYSWYSTLWPEMNKEKLILMVKEHPELYNQNHPGYHDMILKRASWKLIARELKYPGKSSKYETFWCFFSYTVLYI